MNLRTTLLNLAAAAATLALAAGPAAAAGTTAAGSVVKVTLWDKGADSVADVGHGMAMDGATVDKPGRTSMGIKATPAAVKAGEVTFEVTNTSKELVHETILVRAPAEGKAVPYDEQKGLVDEDAAGHLGEVSELEPGKTGALRLELKPGRYALTVTDASKRDNFHLVGKGVNVKTGVAFIGKKTWTIRLAKGTYSYRSDATPRLKGRVAVS
jgi:uncharacterized cupredoxin-like copper-binding protein